MRVRAFSLLEFLITGCIVGVICIAALSVLGYGLYLAYLKWFV